MGGEVVESVLPSRERDGCGSRGAPWRADVASHGVFFATDGPETFTEIVPLGAIVAELFNVSLRRGIFVFGMSSQLRDLGMYENPLCRQISL